MSCGGMQLRQFIIFALLLIDDYGATLLMPNFCSQIQLRNGRVRYRQRGRFVKYSCNVGYMLAGDRYSTCTRGKWDSPLPKCVRATCLKVSPPTNGLIYPSHGGAVLNFYCLSGFELRGPSATFCDGRHWDQNSTSCLPTNKTAPLFCDFETDDLCGWSHDFNHDFDWKRLNYKTPSGSIGTGPSFDHTKGEGKDGFYMYIESSSKNVNDTARLISPVFNKTTSDTCFEFFYHMFGATTGDLRVYLKKVGENWRLSPDKSFFAKNGNQGNKWYRSFHNLGPINDDYQIIIEGVRGSGYVSDIAIDDVRIVENCAEEEEFSTTTIISETSSTEQILSVESCENRCDNNSSGRENELSMMISCDCDDKCLVNSRCCPDYFDFCVLATSSTDEPIETTSTELLTSSQIPRLPPTNFTTTSTLEKTIQTFLPTKPTPLEVVKSTHPPLVIIKAPTTVKIYRKVLTELPKISTTASFKPKIVYVKPNENDVIDIKEITTKKSSDGAEETFYSEELEESELDIKQFNQRIVIATKPDNSNFTVVIVVVSFLVIFGLTLILVVVIRRLRMFRFGIGRRNYFSSNGDSQSDVRFLTSDQSLDFSIPDSFN